LAAGLRIIIRLCQRKFPRKKYYKKCPKNGSSMAIDFSVGESPMHFETIKKRFSEEKERAKATRNLSIQKKYVETRSPWWLSLLPKIPQNQSSKKRYGIQT
jgi:hypothetical protein